LRATEGGVAIYIIDNNLCAEIAQPVPSTARNLSPRNDRNIKFNYITTEIHFLAMTKDNNLFLINDRALGG